MWFNFKVHFLNSTHSLYRRGVFDVIGLRAELPHQKGNGASCMYSILLPLWKIAYAITSNYFRSTDVSASISHEETQAL